MTIKQTTTFSVELTRDELEMIRDLSQNSQGEESERQNKIRLSLFVNSSRALGYNIDDNGSINQNISPSSSTLSSLNT